MNKQTRIVATASPPSLRQTGGAGAASASPHPIATRMFGDALIADASKVSPQEFLAVALDRLFPEPPKTRVSERAEAARRYISAAWVTKDVPALRAAYLRELDAIDAKYRVARDFNSAVIL